MIPINTSTLSLRDLEYIVAVSDLSHFGKAAEMLHVSQPTLSAQIQKAEGLLGVSLFERSKRRVSVTPVGEEIVAQARTVLEEAKKLIGIASQDKAPLVGRFKIGAIATLGPYYFPYLLEPLKKKYPELELYVQEGFTHVLLEELRTGKLDAVLASPTFNEEGFEITPLFIEPFWVALPTGHPLLKEASLSPSSLNASEMVLLEEGNCLKDQALDTCSPNRRGQVKPFQAAGLETLKHLVASGMGYTLIPQLAVREDKLLKNLIQYRPFKSKTIGRKIILVTRQRSPRKKDSDALIEIIRAKMPAGMQAL